MISVINTHHRSYATCLNVKYVILVLNIIFKVKYSLNLI